ncbi:Small-conductance mechanosensitive channel [Halogranum amylolyticum]|uniref:Small-conductance mechanosensitive channel n=1 Tax=Halogranum amylolyticum TaxID=660520 RepID=A0A1H8N9G8_9EURY|nr:mechanosensitive ion channel family protein [Halogranum amylolyticum]SEO26158.1 Small-conductance mechanosensitive channel [Halogranum amylolyticum]
MSFDIAVLATLLLQLQIDQLFPETQQLVTEYVVPAVLFVVAFVVVWLLGRAVLVPLIKRVLDEQGHDPSVKSLAESLTGVVNVILAFAVAFTVAGFGSVIAAFGVFAGAIALAVGFAAQDILGNFVAGIFILKDRPFEVGDWIEVNDITGRVEDIDLRVSRLRTFDNELITVPNGELANNALKNPVAYDKLRQKFVFGIGYDDDIDHAKEVILDEAAKNPDILDDPSTSIRVSELADSYVGLQTRFWIDEPNRSDFVKTRSELVQAVKERCDAEAIDMPYPHTQLTGDIEVEGLQSETATATSDD